MMRFGKKILLTVAFVSACALAAFGQGNVRALEAELVKRLEQVQKYSNYGGDYDGAKLAEANKIFEESLLQAANKSETLNHPFVKLGKLMFIRTSADKKFRTYSWNTEDGGTMRNFSKIFQYRAADGKVYATFDGENEGGSFVHDIFTVKTVKGSIYLVSGTAIFSTQDQYSGIKAFQIKGKRLDDKVKIIRTGKKLTEELGFSYNFFSVVERKERPIKLIFYDNNKKTLKIPVVIENSKFPNGEVTKRFITYKFDGKAFTKIGRN